MTEAPAKLQLEEDFQRLFDRYHQPVYYFFINRGFASDECLDLTQETFLRVYKSMGRFRRDGTMRR